MDELGGKTTAVWREIEIGLANYVLDRVHNFPDPRQGVCAKIIDRNPTLTALLDADVSELAAHIIQESYIEEIFQLAVLVSSGPEIETAKEFQKLAQGVRLFDAIRLAAAHPNRPFLPHYWYCVGALATSTYANQMGLKGLLEAFVAAENGTWATPNEEWLSKYFITIANNLPESFEHTMTGLIGRGSDKKNLIKALTKPRSQSLIALSAYGGVGKTALALDVLDTISRNVEKHRDVDGIVFVSLKSQILTVNGIEERTAPETMNQIENEIYLNLDIMFSDYGIASFNDSIEKLSNKKIILCIDNVEEFIRDNQDQFFSFEESLPVGWKVLVTSRIPLSRRGENIPLKPLGVDDARALVRAYANRKHVTDINSKDVDAIAEQTQGNPLAIRLSLDRLTLGSELPSAVGKTVEEVTNFAFSNLVDILSEGGLKVLELLYQLGQGATRDRVSEVLGMNVDQVAEALSVLLQTTLVFRIDEGEDEIVYALNEAVRNLVMTHEKCMELRKEISDILSRFSKVDSDTEKYQTLQNITSEHWYFIPEDTHQGLKSILLPYQAIVSANTKRGHSGKDWAGKLYKALQKETERYGASPVFQAYLGRASFVLGDKNLAEESYKKALRISNNEKKYKILLAEFYKLENRFDESIELSRETAHECIERTSCGMTQRWAANVYFMSKIFDGKYDDVLDQTKNWKKSGALKHNFGGYRATAKKRLAETQRIPEKLETLHSSLAIFGELLREGACSYPITSTFAKCVDDVIYVLNATSVAQDFPELVMKVLPIIEENISFAYRDGVSITDLETLINTNVPENPFRQHKWISILSSEKERQPDTQLLENVESRISDGDLIRAEIYGELCHPNGDRRNYFFAKDEYENQFFCPFTALESKNRDEWEHVKVGDFVALKVLSMKTEGGKTPPAVELYIL